MTAMILGESFVFAVGLELGVEHFHDEFVGPQREYVLKAYRAVGVQSPYFWVKSEVCSDLLAHLRQRVSGKR